MKFQCGLAVRSYERRFIGGVVGFVGVVKCVGVEGVWLELVGVLKLKGGLLGVAPRQSEAEDGKQEGVSEVWFFLLLFHFEELMGDSTGSLLSS